MQFESNIEKVLPEGFKVYHDKVMLSIDNGDMQVVQLMYGRENIDEHESYNVIFKLVLNGGSTTLYFYDLSELKRLFNFLNKFFL